ncbi:MAG: hypothetical protein ACLVL7_02220 [Anaerotruncus massiliensis (ex Togo et al. 2019)]
MCMRTSCLRALGEFLRVALDGEQMLGPPTGGWRATLRGRRVEIRLRRDRHLQTLPADG